MFFTLVKTPLDIQSHRNWGMHWVWPNEPKYPKETLTGSRIRSTWTSDLARKILNVHFILPKPTTVVEVARFMNGSIVNISMNMSHINVDNAQRILHGTWKSCFRCFGVFAIAKSFIPWVQWLIKPASLLSCRGFILPIGIPITKALWGSLLKQPAKEVAKVLSMAPQEWARVRHGDILISWVISHQVPHLVAASNDVCMS